jgi:hypothetical protein
VFVGDGKTTGRRRGTTRDDDEAMRKKAERREEKGSHVRNDFKESEVALAVILLVLHVRRPLGQDELPQQLLKQPALKRGDEREVVPVVPMKHVSGQQGWCVCVCVCVCACV